MRNKTAVLIAFSFLSTFNLFSQENISNTATVADSSTINNDSTKTIASELLPTQYPLTQRILWGNNGLMRNIDYFKLSEAERDMELDIRSKMITAHRYLGYATLAGMLAQGIVGAQLYNGDRNLKDAHEVLAGAVNIGYFSTAGLALFAPPRNRNNAKGFSTLKLHKALAIVHLSAMIATNILADDSSENANTRTWHRAAAYTAFGSFFVSMVVIHF